MPRPTVGASDRIRISRAGCASCKGRSGACKGVTPATCNVAGSGAVAQGAVGNGVLPSVQCRFSTPLPSSFRGARQREPGIHLTAGFRIASLCSASGMTSKRIRDKDPPMATHKLLLLPGDGIGPEVMAEVKRLIDWLNAQGIAHFETEHGLVGGSAYDASTQSIADATMSMAKSADAVIFGAVGGAKG